MRNQSKTLWTLLTVALICLALPAQVVQAGAAQPEGPAPALQSRLYFPGVGRNFISSSVGQMRLYGYSDASVLMPASFDAQFLATQKSLMCQPPAVTPLDLTIEQAVQNLWARLEQKVGAPALAEFRADPRYDTVPEAQTFAAGSMLYRQMDGAIAGYLRAYEQAPNNALLLINAAGALITAGLPNEALAFLNRADAIRSQPGVTLGAPMGIPGAELAINNRGAALLGQGRWAQAEAVLRPLAASGSELAEARTNLSVALLCQNKDQEAARWYRLGERRRLYDALIPLTPPEVEGTRLPPQYTFDRSYGKMPNIPRVAVAASPQQAEGMVGYYQALFDRHIQRTDDRTALIEANSQLRSARPVPLPVSLKRFASVHVTAMRAENEPDIAPFGEEAQQLQEELADLRNEVGDRIAEASDTLHGEAFKAACRSALQSYWSAWVPTFRQFETAMRTWMELKYVAGTATASHLADELNHEYVSLQIEQIMDNDLDRIATEANTNNGWGATWWPVCDAPEPPPFTPVEDPQTPRSVRCPATWANGKFQITFLEVLQVKGNCEQIETELAAGGSSFTTPFVAFTTDLKNRNYTLYTGVKIRTPTPIGEMSVGEGVYIRGNQHGISDVGAKTQIGGQAGFGPFTYGIEDGIEIGIAGAFEYVTTP